MELSLALKHGSASIGGLKDFLYTASYGINKVEPIYTDVLIRIRRNNAADNAVDTGANDELDIGSSGSGLDTTAIAAFLDTDDPGNDSSDTAYIVTLYNQSAKGTNDWDFETASEQLQLSADTTYMISRAAAAQGVASTQAVGQWEMDIWAEEGLTLPCFYFMSNAIAQRYSFIGYLLLYYPAANWGGGFILRRSNGFSFVSMAEGKEIPEAPTGNWNRFKVKRCQVDSDYVFTVYAKNVQAGGAYAISPANFYGTNPVTENTVTESTYFVLDLDVGDRIKNFMFKGGLCT